MNIRPYKISDTGLYHKEADPAISESVKQIFAGILNTCLRVSDIPAHYGDDFVVLLPVTDEIGRQAVAQRLISKLQGTRNFADGNMFKFSIHIGISTHPGGRNISADNLLQQAQAALELARQSGPQSYFLFPG